MRILVIGFLLASVACSALPTDSDFAQCRQLFPYGNPPVVQHQEDFRPHALCFSEFAVLHSGRSRTPVYAAERLSKARLVEAEGIPRPLNFYAEARLPRVERAELVDYQASEFDRGHMAPAADMATYESMMQSFSLANVVPQPPVNNRKLWQKIEMDTRKYIKRAKGDVYVITGPVFEQGHATIGPNDVWVPQHLFKLVFDPSSNRAWAHWLDNTDTAVVGSPISYDELVRRTGIEFLPGWRNGERP